MPHSVGVAKAARILGISRTKLQNMIRGGDLQTFEGLVDLDELKRCFPALAIEDDSMLERTQIIRDNAYGERVKQRVAPSTETLKSQIRRLKVDLSVERTKARAYQQLFTELLDTLSELQQTHNTDTKRVVADINGWLLDKIEQNK